MPTVHKAQVIEVDKPNRKRRCVYCCNIFIANITEVKKGKAKFCNAKCYAEYRKLPKPKLQDNREYVYKRKLNYYRSRHGLLVYRYLWMVRRCKQLQAYKARSPNFTKEEFLRKFKNDNNLIRLIENWKVSGYLERLTPTVDRINNKLGYRLDNIQFLTMEDNTKKYREIDSKLAGEE